MYKPLKIQKFLREDGSMGELRQDPYNLSINTDENGRRILFKYSQIESNLSLDITREARGLILDRENNWDVLSFPFRKFFNYEEGHAADIDWNTARVFEKLDGTCSVLYYFEDDWVMHTLGTVEGEGPVHVDDILSIPFDGTFSDLFFHAWKNIYGEDKIDELDENYIYVFELMTPYNIVVKEHKDYKISLLAVRNRETLDEISLSNFEKKFDTPKRYDFNNPTPEKLKEMVKEFPPDEEGYVVCDGNYNRIKLKNPAYVTRHRMKDNAINKKNGVLEIILDEKDDDFIGTFPDLKDDINEVKKKLQELADYLNSKFVKFNGYKVDPNNSKERKEYALSVQEEISGTMRGFMFHKLENKSQSFLDIFKNSRSGKVANSINNFEMKKRST